VSLSILSLSGLCHRNDVSFVGMKYLLILLTLTVPLNLQFFESVTTLTPHIRVLPETLQLSSEITRLPLKVPVIWLTIFSASLANRTAFLLQSRDCGCYGSRKILAPPLLRLRKHTDLRAHGFAHSRYLWHQPRLANITRAWSWRFCGMNSAIPCSIEPFIQPYVSTSLTFFVSLMVVCIGVVINIYVSQSFFSLSFIAKNTTLILPLACMLHFSSSNYP
jgi:hypothetical protein